MLVQVASMNVPFKVTVYKKNFRRSVISLFSLSVQCSSKKREVTTLPTNKTAKMYLEDSYSSF